MARTHRCKVQGNTNNSYFGVTTERVCEIIKEYFYNGETHYTLKDAVTGEKFDSPTVFWKEIKEI